jgi:hypothetical protein
VQVLPWEPGPTIASFPEVFARDSFSIRQAALTPDGWRLESPTMARLLAKIRASGPSLETHIKSRFFYGVKTGFNDAFVLTSRQERDDLVAADPAAAAIIKPFIRGRDVKRWTVDFAEQFLIVIESSENKSHPWSDKPAKAAEATFKATYPGIWKRFDAYRDELVKREDQGRFFWELRSCAYWSEFDKPKIAYQEIATFQSFAWDASGYVATNKVFIIPEATPFVLGILNSRPAWWLLNQVSTKMVGGALALQMPFLGQVPIPAASSAATKQIERRVLSILEKKSESATNFVGGLEAEIDGLVAHLYGLTEEEFRILLNDLDLTEPVRTSALQAFRDVARGHLK